MQKHNFPVELTPIKTRYQGQTIAIPDRKAVVRTDKMIPLGIVSTKYELLKHDDVVKGFREALKDHVNYEETIQIAKNGAQLYATYSIPDLTVEIRPNDRVALQFIVKNSYDGSNALQITLGAFRLVCTNGMIIGKKFFTFSQKHIGSEAGKVDTGILKEKVKMLSAKLVEALPVMQEMAATPVTIDSDELFDPKKIKMPKYLLEIARGEFEKVDDRSLWGFYNSLTWAVTHSMKKESPYRTISYGKVAWDEATKGLR